MSYSSFKYIYICHFPVHVFVKYKLLYIILLKILMTKRICKQWIINNCIFTEFWQKQSLTSTRYGYPEIYFFNIFFYSLNFKYVLIHTKKRKIKKKISRGCATPPNVPKLGVSGVKDTAKTNKDWGKFSCCIQVEYSVFFHW